MDNAENERIPLSYLLKYAKQGPEYRDAMPIERMLMRYYLEAGRGEMAMRLSDEIHDHFMPVGSNRPKAITDEQAKELLVALMKTGVIGIQAQFVGVYRVLVDFGDFPAEMTSFSRRVIGLKLVFDGKELEYKSFYQSIQKGIQSHPVLPLPYKKWATYVCKEGERASTFMRQKAVADKLLELMRERNLIQVK